MTEPAFLRPALFPSSSSKGRRRQFSCSRKPSIICAVSGGSVTFRELDTSELPPRPPKHYSVPVLGFAIENLLGLRTRCDEKHKKYGDLYWSDYLLHNTTFVADYATIIDVLRDPVHFPSGDGIPSFVQMFGSDNIVNLDGTAHAAARDLNAPAFAGPVLDYYFQLVRERVEDTWKSVHSRANDNPTREPVKLDPVFREMYLGIVIEMTTGISWGSDQMDTLVSNCRLILDALSMPPFGPGRNRALLARHEIRSIVANIVKDRVRQDRDVLDEIRLQFDDAESTKRIAPGIGIDLLHILIAKSGLSTTPGAQCDDDEVSRLVRAIVVIWFAGYATTAVTSSCASFELGWDAELYSRLTEEQDALVSTSGKVEVSVDQLKKMPILDGFMMEMLRLYPASPGTGRQVAQDVELLGKYVPKGEHLFLDFFTVHRNPALFANPEKIDPERWTSQPKPPALLTFGAPGSPHYCLGATFAKVMFKTAFATLLRRYSYKLNATQSREYQPFETLPLDDSVPKSLVLVQQFMERETK